MIQRAPQLKSLQQKVLASFGCDGGLSFLLDNELSKLQAAGCSDPSQAFIPGNVFNPASLAMSELHQLLVAEGKGQLNQGVSMACVDPGNSECLR
ncbi:MAG: Uncharacterised protein [Synechococcus sp. CC9902]|nr:MAG: Uncharacterised protein [Synechococcus sp. CC9902]